MAAVVSVGAVLVLQLALFPIPFGVWLQGAVLGLLGSLMAVGLGLTYRLNKVINFAQGDLGTAPAVLAVGLIGFSGVNYFLGLATGLVASLLLTATAEILVVRRFRRSPRLILTVATIGLSQLLVVLSLLIPRIWGQAPIATAVAKFPWHLTWHVGPVVFDADDLVAVIVSLACLAAVSLWFTRSDVGLAVQAVGDRRDRASMLGIPVGRLQSVTWVVAGVLSFVSIFFQATILGLPLDPTYGLTALVTALAALALGNFSELPVIAASAVALGILEQGVAWDDPANPALGLAVLAGVVFAAIVVRQLLANRTDREAESSLALAGSVRELPARLRDLTEVRVGAPVGALVAFAAAATLPLWLGPGEVIRGSALVVLAIVGCSVVVLTGWSGQVSLGQMSFAAVGATVGAVALADWHWDLSLALLLAGAAAGAVAVVVGIPTLRLDGMFAAVTTLAFSLAASGYLLVREEFSWIPQSQLGVPYLFGLSLSSQTAVFEVCLGVLVLVLLALHGLRHSRTGRVLPRAASQRAGGVGLRRARPAGQAHRVRPLRFHRRPGRLPLARGEPVVPGDIVPGAGQLGRVHLDGGRRIGVRLRRHPRCRHRRGQRHLPAAELAALPVSDRRAARPHPLPARPGRPLLRPARLGPRGVVPPSSHGRARRPRPGRRGAGPVSRLAKLGGGASLFPLGVLFAIELLDQATQSAFNVLTPNIRDAFHLTNAGILLIVAIAGAAALACTLPIAVLADRTNRVRIALVGALVGAAFSIGLGVAQGVVVATIMLVGVSMGQAVIFPTHNSLLADYYPVPARPRIYSAHRSGINIGAIVGVLLGAGLAAVFSWRAPFFFFAVPIVLVVIVGLRLREPPRGRHEQLELSEQMLASERGEPAPLDDAPSPTLTVVPDSVAALDVPVEAPPSLGEAWRTVWKIGVLRRIFIALPFLAAAIAGFTSLASLQYQETFHLDAVQRAYLIAPIQVFDLLGLAVGAVIATRLARRDIGLVFRMLAVASMVAAGFAVLFALAPTVPLAFVGNAGIDFSLAIVGPGVLASLSIAIPSRVRSVGFSIGALFVLPGFLVLPSVGALGDAVGFRYGLLILVPIFVIGGLIVASAGGLIGRDVQDVWNSMRTRTQMLVDRQAGRLPLLAVRELNVGYDGVVVLDDVAIDIGEGEIVALVGTNGAGKSTLLRAIGGVVEADHGAIVFDGRDITHLPPDEIARLGVAQVPGGEGIFPNLRVEDNLRVAAWQGRRRGEHDADMIDEALSAFPTLDSRRDERAANLSGGQQQMLALAMATITRPKLFLIDELSLGLSPIVVEQLLGAIETMRQGGTAILLVEQSMNVAVAVADRVYVMETGVVRFSGTAEELAAHPELLWSVYLDKAAKAMESPPPALGAPSGAGRGLTEVEVRGLSLSFGGNNALNDVSLHADHGEIVGIIGPNGAGKTTLFDVVSGFLRPDTGSVELAGLDVTDRTASARARLGLGRSFQDSRLFSGLTVRDAVAVSLERFTDVSDPFNAILRLPLQVRTEAAVMERVDELLDLFGLDRYADNLVSELSTGSRRLVDLAAVVAHQPSVVLLDEPSSGVAQREVEAMVGLLRNVRDRLNATMLVVEHDIAFIAELADRLVAMDQGAVLTSGAPRHVLESPLVGEAFLGSDPLALSRSGAATTTTEVDPP